MASVVDNATGSVLLLVTSTTALKLTSIKWAGIGRDSLDSSVHSNTGWRSFIPTDLQDPGELEFEGYHVPDVQPPSSAVTEVMRLTFPLQTGQSVASKMEASGFVTKWDIEAALEDMIKVKGKIKLTGAITFTAST